MPKTPSIPIGTNPFCEWLMAIQQSFIKKVVMQFFTRKLVKPGDLNGSNTLFGGRLLSWIDEEAYIFATCQLNNNNVVTKYMSEVNFVSSAKRGDIVEIGIELLKFGTTSITLKCEVRNKLTQVSIIRIDELVFVNLDDNGQPKAHGFVANDFEN